MTRPTLQKFQLAVIIDILGILCIEIYKFCLATIFYTRMTIQMLPGEVVSASGFDCGNWCDTSVF